MTRGTLRGMRTSGRGELAGAKVGNENTNMSISDISAKAETFGVGLVAQVSARVQRASLHAHTRACTHGHTVGI